MPFRNPLAPKKQQIVPVKRKGTLGAKILFFVVLILLILAIVTQF